MNSEIQSPRESYRQRLYRDYLANHHGPDLRAARAGVHSAAPYLRRLIQKHLPPNRDIKVLDLGCGYGALLYWLRHSGYKNLIGVDCSAEQVEGARALGLDCVRQGDLLEYMQDKKGASCDVIFAFDVLEHFTKDETLRFGEEVLRMLSPGGLLILHMPNGEGLFFGCVAYGDFTHESIFTRQSIRQLLRCVGFSKVTSFEDVPVISGLISAARCALWKVYRCFFRLAYAAETGDLGRELILSQNFLTVARK